MSDVSNLHDDIELLDKKEVSRLLKISMTDISQPHRRREIGLKEIRFGRKVLFLKSDIVELIRSRYANDPTN